MKDGSLSAAEKYTSAHRRRRLWYRVVTCLACVVVFCTVYALILPAITLENTGCEIPEHTHTQACYTQVTAVQKTVPVCSEETLSIHRHTQDCYDGEGDLTCGKADFVVHHHDAPCYDENGKLWCPLPEIEAHQHTESCYAQPEVHTHTDGCYTRERGELICTEHVHTDECYQQVQDLVCGLEESEDHCHDDSCYETRRELVCGNAGDHQHTDECYTWNEVLTCDLSPEADEEAGPVLVCGKTEVVLHRHTADCYDGNGTLTCGKPEVQAHQHTDACFETVTEPVDTEALTCTLPEDENHTHTALCYGTWELTCGMEEHRHSEECRGTEEALEQGDLIMVFPAGAQIPAGYDAQYQYIDPDNRFGVMVYAPEGALPEGAVLSAELLEQGSEDYEAAEQALADTAYDGFAAMDIRFLLDGEEVEPESSVYVCINVMGILPETADPESLAVQHHTQPQNAALFSLRQTGGTTVETVADAGEETGPVEILDNGNTAAHDLAAAFELESFSTFTVTWQDSYKLILHYVDADGNSIFEGDDETALATYSKLESVTLSQYANRISHSGYAYESAYVLHNDEKPTVAQVRYNKDVNKWQYTVDGNNWSEWMDGTNHTAEVYLSYTAVEGKTIVPPENNVYPVDAINVWDENANVILISRKWRENGNLEELFGERQFDNYYFIRIEMRSDGRYQVIQAEGAANTSSTQAEDAFMLLVKKTYVQAHTMYIPNANWPEGLNGDHTTETNGDTAQINLQCGETEETKSKGVALAYITFSPKTSNATAEARADDVAAVADSAIKFQLFNYSKKINRPNGSGEGDSWRSITPYFQFRGQEESRHDLANDDRNNSYDADGFPVNHATVERTLTNNYPVLDPNRNALGNAKSPTVTEEALHQSERSLAYLFRSGDGAVTAYSPSNTILQKSGTHYYYNSAYNAVDYDTNHNVFRVRNYVERNSSTATYSSAQDYFDFLPFNYTDGEVVGTYGYDARTYNLESSAVDYWFGMRMDVDFYQGKNGQLNGEDMVFHFSGDDDVWVFIDDVLVLDLGGTHGTVTGYINFATGEIQQYLDWNGVIGTKDVTSFPTTIKECYEEAEKEPNGGWNSDGNTFADYTKHKLSFFYMERGCAVANCAIDFNLPTLPEKSLQVTKDLVANQDADQDVVNHLRDTMTYKFRVVKAGADGKPTETLLIKEGDPYTLSGTGISGSQKCAVGADGYFTLKSGQIAEFSNMLSRFDENENLKQYFVQEVLPSDLIGQYGDIIYTVGSGTGTCEKDTTSIGTDFTGFNSPILESDVGNLVSYKNVVDTKKLSTLEITKVKTGSALNGEPEFYYMKVQLGPDANSLEPISVGTTYFVGDGTRSVKQAGIIQLKAGETAKVKLLAGTYYKVEEVANENGTELTGNEGYTPTYSDNASGIVTQVDSTVEITVTNTFPSGALELTKIVNNTAGGSTDGEFAFELKFPVGENWTATDYAAAYTTGSTHTGNMLSFTKQDGCAVATVKLYHGETVTITGLPSGAQVSITETNADGYSVGWSVNGQEDYVKPVKVSIVAGKTAAVECTNTTGYELPQTGGTGTTLYTIGGLLLMTAAVLLLLYNHTKRRKEDSISS